MELYDIETQLANTDTELSQFKQFIYGTPEVGPDGEYIFTNGDGARIYKSKKDNGDVAFVTDDTNLKRLIGWVDKYKGLVDTNIGIVTSYNSKITQNGSFECSVELVSQNATILDNEISSDNNLKFIFANKMEDILIQALTGENLGKRIKDYNVLNANSKKEFLNAFFSKSQEDGAVGFIPEDAVKVGVYYETDTPNNQSSLYISFGLFNDLFLNNFVAKNTKKKIIHEINFKLRDYYVRYETNLYKRQVSIMATGDSLPIFLYPEDWTDSLDGVKDENTGCGSISQQKDATNLYGTPVIPLRELFLNVSVIKEAFQKKTKCK